MALEAIRKGWCVSSGQFNRTRKAFICFRLYWQPRNLVLILAACLLIFDRLRLDWCWHEATRSHALHNPYNLASPFLGNGTEVSRIFRPRSILIARSDGPTIQALCGAILPMRTALLKIRGFMQPWLSSRTARIHARFQRIKTLCKVKPAALQNITAKIGTFRQIT